jgi:hypothetical protein
MPHTKEIIMVRMTDDDDRFVTRPVMIPVHAIDIAALIPNVTDGGVINVDVSPHPHVLNYPAPNYYRVKPAGNNPYPLPYPVSYSFADCGVLAEFRFDDADGTTAVDEVSKYVLTEAGNPTWQTTAAAAGHGSGVALDGTGDILTAAITAVPNLAITTGDFSIEILVTLTTGIAETTLVEQRAATDGVGWTIGTDASDQLEFKIEDASGEVASTGETDIADGTTKHIVVTFDRDGNGTPYINGAAGTAVDISGAALTISNTGAFAVGGDSDSSAGSLTTGTFFFLRMYNRVLTADEVLQNYRVMVGNEFPGWMRVIDQADGADADVVATGQDPGGVDVGAWLRAFRGCYARFTCATEQTTSRTYDFGWIFSGVT